MYRVEQAVANCISPAAKRGEGQEDSQSVPVAGQIGITSHLLGTELHGIIVLVTGDVFDFHALPLTDAVVDRKAQRRTGSIRRPFHNTLDGCPIGSTSGWLLLLCTPLLPARAGDRRLLDLRLHRAALPLTLGLRCGRLRGMW